jgi:hypothetical protein
MVADAVPKGVADVAERLSETRCKLVCFSANGDVLYDAHRQFEYYRLIRQALPSESRDLVDIQFAYDEESGHDHFLTKKFLDHVPDLRRRLYDDVPQESFETRAIHRGNGFREQTGALIPPIYLTSTFESGNRAGFDYTRSGNPNFTNLEGILSSLENASYATVYGSGVAAITAVVSSLQAGDLVLAEEVIYGCTFRLFDRVFAKFGVSIEYYDFTKPENLQLIVDKRPALVWVESPTNPLLKVIDSSPYDRAMRRIHNYMKDTDSFKNESTGYQEIRFPPFSAWSVFTDGISHSAVSGRYAFITTILVPLANLSRPEWAPYHVLEALGA